MPSTASCSRSSTAPLPEHPRFVAPSIEQGSPTLARIEKSIQINRSPDDVWAVVGDIGAISTWMPAIGQSSFTDVCASAPWKTAVCSVSRSPTAMTPTVDTSTRSPKGRCRSITTTHGCPWTRRTTAPGDTWITEIALDDMAAMELVFDEGMQSIKAHLEQS